MTLKPALNTDMSAYYARRASTFDMVYAKPERQHDLVILREWVRTTLAGHRILELACGTGYWTAEAAQVAQSVLATDLAPAMIAIATARKLSADKVSFAIDDAFDSRIDLSTQPVSAVFAAFWWSHVRREEQDRFMVRLRQQVGKDALLVLIDNVYVEGSSTSIARTDLQGNTFQIRLQDGERFEILKNFPTDSALRKRLGAHLKDIRIQRVEHYWMLTGRLK